MSDGIEAGRFVIYWVEQRACFWLEDVKTGEGMDFGRDELEAMLAAYWKENF